MGGICVVSFDETTNNHTSLSAFSKVLTSKQPFNKVIKLLFGTDGDLSCLY